MIELDLDCETLNCLGMQLVNDEWRLFFGESNLEQAIAALALTPPPADQSLFLPAVSPIRTPREVVKHPAGEAPRRKLYTGKETSAMLGITEAQLREFVRHGEISYIAIGRGQTKMRRGFEQDDIDKFLAVRRRTEEWPKHPAPSRSGRTRRSSSTGSGSVDESFMSRLKRLRSDRRSATSGNITRKP
jgi:hypothetical protein